MRTIRSFLAVMAVLVGFALSGCAIISRPYLDQDIKPGPDFGDGVEWQLHAAHTRNQEGKQITSLVYFAKKPGEKTFLPELSHFAEGDSITFKGLDVVAATTNGALGQYLRRPNITRFSIANESQGGSAYSSSWADAFVANWNSNSNWNLNSNWNANRTTVNPPSGGHESKPPQHGRGRD